MQKAMMLALRGERERGGGGVVYVDAARGTAGYLLAGEVEPAELRTQIEEQLTEEGDRMYFFAIKTEGEVHVSKMAKADAYAACAPASA